MSTGIRTPPITMKDAAAVGLSVLRNLGTEGGMKEVNKQKRARRTLAKYSNAKRAAFSLSSSLRAKYKGFLAWVPSTS